jgi:hypothetical protein
LARHCDTLETDEDLVSATLTQPAANAGETAELGDLARNAATAAVARGAARVLGNLGFAVIAEFDFPTGRRADLFGIGRDGELVVVEVKSCLADFRADAKWPEYQDYCDRLFFAVDERFPSEILPEDAGLIVADGFGGAILRPAPSHPLAAARRKALTLRAARAAAFRLERRARDGTA